ncbi:Tetratricopeptide repeat domain 7 [Carabus blaptoides fortunei]
MTTRAARNNTVRIETDIEKSREESNWTKVIELAEQLKEKSPHLECLSHFLIGEGKLENYLEEYPPVESNAHRAKLGLIESKKFLQLAANELGRKAGVALDAHLLLGKLHYACGQYAESLKSYNLAELQALTEKRLPVRSLRIVAESFSIKGLCLEQETPASSKFKQAEREADMLRCFELASDLALLYMQELDKQPTTTITSTGSYSPQPPPHNKHMGPVLELALQKAPALHIRQGQLDKALERYRLALSAVEASGTHTIRLKFLKQLADLLLRGAGGNDYKPPVTPPIHGQTKSTPWKPKQYSDHNQFNPRNECEEILLVLLVAEAMAVKDAVLSQSPEFKEARIRAYQNATAVYDLLTIATVRWGQVSLLQESFERAMKFSFEEPHVWEQHALSLISMGRYAHALAVLREVIRLQPNKALPCMLATRLCFEHLGRTAEGLHWAQQARSREQIRPQGLLGRCWLYVGIGYQLMANGTHLKQDKGHYSIQALEAFQKAIQLEPNDHLCSYYLGLQLALCGHVPEALTHVRTALALRPESSATLQLLALLLSASRQHTEALQLVSAALQEYPDCLNLLYVRAHLELHEDSGDTALATAKHMLVLWKNLYEGQTMSDVPECDRKSDTRSVFQFYTSEMSDKDSSSLQAHSIAASKVEHALSEVASSMSSFSPRPGPQRAWLLQLEVWLLLAELYLSLDQLPAVQQCIQEATQIFPLSHHIMHMRGLMHMHKQEWNEAKLCFQNAVAINPQHIKSLQQLGLVYHYLGQQRLAETTLRDAAKIDPMSHMTWYNLGKVLESLGDYEAASDCMSTALTVEKSSPVLPFNSVPLCFE